MFLSMSCLTLQAEIEKALESVCGMLPATMKPLCASTVKQYGPMIVQMLIAEMKPDIVCNALGLCNKGNILVLVFDVL